MKHLGNDIISLVQNENRLSFTRPRYLQKAFTTAENSFLELHAKSIQILPFLMWSCKESAYKAMVKTGLRDSFCPFEFEINTRNLDHQIPVLNNAIDPIEGCVTYKQTRLFTESHLNQEYIHTIASIDQFSSKKHFWNILKIDKSDPESQSTMSRDFLRQSLSERTNIPMERIEIHNDRLTDVPYVYIDQEQIRVDVSLSHDRNYISFAYLLS